MGFALLLSLVLAMAMAPFSAADVPFHDVGASLEPAPGKFTVHSDRGPAMTSMSVALLMSDLGIIKTHSRPHVLNNNPFSESQSKTVKSRPDFAPRRRSACTLRRPPRTPAAAAPPTVAVAPGAPASRTTDSLIWWEPTAGTNGNISTNRLPSGFTAVFTGMKVLKHDQSRDHGVGILPTVPVSPTIAGLADGRDEQLEKALEIVNR